MYIIIRETDCQSRFDAWDRVLGAGALGWPRGVGWGGRLEGVSGWGTHVHPWWIHVNVWQKPLQYCKVISLQLKKKKRKKPSVFVKVYLKSKDPWHLMVVTAAGVHCSVWASPALLHLRTSLEVGKEKSRFRGLLKLPTVIAYSREQLKSRRLKTAN